MNRVYDIVRGFGILHTSWWSPLLGAAIGGGGMILIDLIGMLVYKKTGMGFGDVKLFGAIGLLTGFPGTLYAYAIAFVSALICFCVIMIIVRILARRERKKEAQNAQEKAGAAQQSTAQEEPVTAAIQTSEENPEEVLLTDEQPLEKPASEGGEEASEDTENGSGSYLAFGPYIAISLICYLVFYDFIHRLVEMYLRLF